MIRDVERYIRKATRWLWGKRKSEVQEELQAHFYDRMQQFFALGLSEQEACKRVIEELGGANTIANPMGALYGTPVAGFLVLSMLAALYYMPHNVNVPALSITTKGPLPFCVSTQTLEDDCMLQEGQSWIHTGSAPYLGSALKWNYNASLKQLELVIPGGRQLAIPSAFSDRQEGMVQTETFLKVLAESSETPITIWGIERPILFIGYADQGGQMLRLGTDKQVVSAERFYAKFLESNLIKPVLGPIDYALGQHSSIVFGQPVYSYHYNIYTKSSANTVYALVSPHSSMPASTKQSGYYDGLNISIVATDNQGVLQYQSDVPKLTLVQSLKPMRDTLYQDANFSSKHVLLVRFTGRIDQGAQGLVIETPINIEPVAR